MSGDYSIRRTGQEMAEALWLVSQPPPFFIYSFFYTPHHPPPPPPPTITRPFIYSFNSRGPLSSYDPHSQTAAPISPPVCSFPFFLLLLLLPLSLFFVFHHRDSSLVSLPPPPTTPLPPSSTQTSRVASHNFEWFPFCRWFSAGQCLLLLGMTGGVYTGDQPARRRAKLPH